MEERTKWIAIVYHFYENHIVEDYHRFVATADEAVGKAVNLAYDHRDIPDFDVALYGAGNDRPLICTSVRDWNWVA
jgi:hypothetical protein